MSVVWEPDPDNVYFSSGSDNLALHQIAPAELAQYQPLRGQLLDHVGVVMESPAHVDEMYRDVQQDAVHATAPPSPRLLNNIVTAATPSTLPTRMETSSRPCMNQLSAV
jgi:hypothetical protein